MKFIPNSVTRTLARQVLVVKKQSPHILFASGVVGVIGSTVLACRATLKLEDTLKEMNHDIEGVKKDHLPGEYQKELAYVYGKGTLTIGRLYAPAIIVGVASIGALTGSHVTLTRRNTALTAAYAGLARAYDEYRDRVRAEVGESKELDLYHGIEYEKVKVDGKLQEVAVANLEHGGSPYARFFDEYSTQWQRNAEYNRIFIQCQQNYANDLLHARGHVFLNEVYDMLGFERTKAGSIVGWWRDGNGDGYIDFGLMNVANKVLLNPWEQSYLLDFNVDGIINNQLG